MRACAAPVVFPAFTLVSEGFKMTRHCNEKAPRTVNIEAFSTDATDSAVCNRRIEQVTIHGALVVRFIKQATNHVTPRSNLFQRKTTGEALISAMPVAMRCLSSAVEVTRMCRRNVRAIFENAHSIRLSQEPCLGV